MNSTVESPVCPVFPWVEQVGVCPLGRLFRNEPFREKCLDVSCVLWFFFAPNKLLS